MDIKRLLPLLVLPLWIPVNLPAQDRQTLEEELKQIQESCREEGAAEGLSGKDLDDYTAICTEDLVTLSIDNQLDIRQK